ncbi:hypothetical protein DFJ73DRAFT_849162 [Zopfochytrium polystomum]|nr:hypothetical protein DFJ73DRAFT_849162 [Zopfochytrium polystomum]
MSQTSVQIPPQQLHQRLGSAPSLSSNSTIAQPLPLASQVSAYGSTSSLPKGSATPARSTPPSTVSSTGAMVGSAAQQSGYHEITDPQTGRVFYANVVTGDCTWDRPVDAVVHPKDPSGNEWWELFDDNHKLPYYYNTKTGETEWLKPETGNVIPLIAIQNSTIGKRVSVILKRNSMLSSAGFAENAAKLGSSASSDPRMITPTSASSTPNSLDRHYQQQAQQQLATPSPSSRGRSATPPRSGGGSPIASPKPMMSGASKFLAAQQEGWRKGARSPPTVGEPVNNPELARAMSPLSSIAMNAPPTPVNPVLESLPKVKSEKLLPEDLKRHISQFQIDGFAKKYFSEHRKGIFRRKVPLEHMLIYTKDSLRQPLMTLPKALHKEALKCFKLIQKIMADTSRGPPYPGSSKDMQALMEKGILQGALRDEIYVQICKQVTKNPNGDSTVRGWILLSVMTIGFPPSKNFEEYLKSFVAQSFDGVPVKWADEAPATFGWCRGPEGQLVGQVAKHAHRSLARICKAGPRGKTPVLAEIERAQEAPFQAVLFGETLEEIMRVQHEAEIEEAVQSGQPADSVRHLAVPKILLFLADAVLKLNGCQTEGIFRVPGDIDMVNDLRVRVEKGNFDLAGISDPNVPSSLLKLWLRELADPLIPSDKYDLCIAVGHQEGSAKAGQAAVDILKSVPEINRKVALYVIKFLKVVADPANHSYTRMTTANIAMVFAPNFLRCPSDNPTVIFENTKYEQAFLRVLMTQSSLDGL